MVLQNLDYQTLASYERAAKIEPVADYEDVVAHCDGLFFEFRNLDADSDRLVRSTIVNVNKFSKMLKANPGYHGGDIRLFACSAGKYDDGAAQLLADQLGVKIKAPVGDVKVYNDGSFIVEIGGIPKEILKDKDFQEKCWRVFEPRG